MSDIMQLCIVAGLILTSFIYWLHPEEKKWSFRSVLGFLFVWYLISIGYYALTL